MEEEDLPVSSYEDVINLPAAGAEPTLLQPGKDSCQADVDFRCVQSLLVCVMQHGDPQA